MSINPEVSKHKPDTPERAPSPVDADDIPNTMPFDDHERDFARKFQDQHQRAQAAEPAKPGYFERGKDKWKKDGKKTGKVALVVGGISVAATAAAAIFVGNSLNQASDTPDRNNPVPPRPPQNNTAPLNPVEAPRGNQSPDVVGEAPGEVIVDTEPSTEQLIREARASASNEELANDPDLWVYPDLPTGPDSYKREVYGATLEEDLQIKSNGIFTEYVEGGALTIIGKFDDLVNYGLQVPHTYNPYDLQDFEALPVDLRPYDERVHETIMSNLFATHEQNGDLAQYLDNWGRESIDFRYGIRPDDYQGADTELDLTIPDVDSFQNLELDGMGNQLFRFENVEITKSYGSDKGTAVFDFTLGMSPVDSDGDGDPEHFTWRVVDSQRITE